MIARVLDPVTQGLVLVCGPGWSSRCGAAGENAPAVFCAGHPVLLERENGAGPRTLRVFVNPKQRSCPFGPPEVRR